MGWKCKLGFHQYGQQQQFSEHDGVTMGFYKSTYVCSRCNKKDIKVGWYTITQ